MTFNSGQPRGVAPKDGWMLPHLRGSTRGPARSAAAVLPIPAVGHGTVPRRLYPLGERRVAL